MSVVNVVMVGGDFSVSGVEGEQDAKLIVRFSVVTCGDAPKRWRW